MKPSRQKLAEEKAAAAASTAAYQSKLAYDAMVEELMEALAIEQEIEAFEAKLAADLAAQEMMVEIEEELARQAALEAFQKKLAEEKLPLLHLLQLTNPSLHTMLWLKNLWKL